MATWIVVARVLTFISIMLIIIGFATKTHVLTIIGAALLTLFLFVFEGGPVFNEERKPSHRDNRDTHTGAACRRASNDERSEFEIDSNSTKETELMSLYQIEMHDLNFAHEYLTFKLGDTGGRFKLHYQKIAEAVLQLEDVEQPVARQNALTLRLALQRQRDYELEHANEPAGSCASAGTMLTAEK
jgi:hypothetical protein